VKFGIFFELSVPRPVAPGGSGAAWGKTGVAIAVERRARTAGSAARTRAGTAVNPSICWPGPTRSSGT
jgi:hypothetical protein